MQHVLNVATGLDVINDLYDVKSISDYGRR